MKKRRVIFLLIALILGSFTVLAQSRFSPWPYFVELSPTNPGLYEITVPFHVLRHARDDLGDLRLFDSQDREIPYAIVIRREIHEQREFEAKVFNKVTVGTSTEATVDLGEDPGEHNEIQVQTSGRNFRRRVMVEGSDTGDAWRTLKSNSLIFLFESDGRKVASNDVSYPTSRFRYLRVHVAADELTDGRAPDITEIRVLRVVHQQGQLSQWSVPVPSYQLLRNRGAYASSWTIDLGARVPIDRLTLSIADSSFYRPFQIEAVDDPQSPRLIASGNLSRRTDENRTSEVIVFDQEEHLQKLRLQITDFSNQVLTIGAIQAGAPARELVFQLKQPQNAPLRLFFGNSKIEPPHYDFEKELSTLQSTPSQTTVFDLSNNPAYVPEPVPFTERVPWLIYVVLAASSIALGWILLSLARGIAKRPEPSGSGPQDAVRNST